MMIVLVGRHTIELVVWKEKQSTGKTQDDVKSDTAVKLCKMHVFDGIHWTFLSLIY